MPAPLCHALLPPDAQFVLLNDVGHCPMDDRPEALHKELLPWLQRQFAAASSSGSTSASAPAS
jgi:pimeloyl-ACP methyl ester carboxylesterase